MTMPSQNWALPTGPWNVVLSDHATGGAVVIHDSQLSLKP